MLLRLVCTTALWLVIATRGIDGQRYGLQDKTPSPAGMGYGIGQTAKPTGAPNGNAVVHPFGGGENRTPTPTPSYAFSRLTPTMPPSQRKPSPSPADRVTPKLPENMNNNDATKKPENSNNNDAAKKPENPNNNESPSRNTPAPSRTPPPPPTAAPETRAPPTPPPTTRTPDREPARTPEPDRQPAPQSSQQSPPPQRQPGSAQSFSSPTPTTPPSTRRPPSSEGGSSRPQSDEPSSSEAASPMPQYDVTTRPPRNENQPGWPNSNPSKPPRAPPQSSGDDKSESPPPRSESPTQTPRPTEAPTTRPPQRPTDAPATRQPIGGGDDKPNNRDEIATPPTSRPNRQPDASANSPSIISAFDNIESPATVSPPRTPNMFDQPTDRPKNVIETAPPTQRTQEPARPSLRTQEPAPTRDSRPPATIESNTLPQPSMQPQFVPGTNPPSSTYVSQPTVVPMSVATVPPTIRVTPMSAPQTIITAAPVAPQPSAQSEANDGQDNTRGTGLLGSLLGGTKPLISSILGFNIGL